MLSKLLAFINLQISQASVAMHSTGEVEVFITVHTGSNWNLTVKKIMIKHTWSVLFF